MIVDFNDNSFEIPNVFKINEIIDQDYNKRLTILSLYDPILYENIYNFLNTDELKKINIILEGQQIANFSNYTIFKKVIHHITNQENYLEISILDKSGKNDNINDE